MKEKTLQKLQRKFLSLPLHHIDTDVIIEPENAENGRCCTRYMKRAGIKYRGRLSIPVLGEILLYTIKELKDKKNQYTMLDLILGFISERKIEFASVDCVEEIISKIKQIDSRIEPMDRLNLACAVADGADTFVTLDGKLLGNKKLVTELNIEIKNPSEFPLS